MTLQKQKLTSEIGRNGQNDDNDEKAQIQYLILIEVMACGFRREET